MKAKKVSAVILAAAMAASVTGCTKIKSANMEEFTSAWDGFGAEEMDLDDFDSIRDDEFKEQLGDGFYFRFEPRDIDHIDMYFAMLKINNLTLNIDDDDIEEICIAGRADYNLDEYDIDDIGNLDDIVIDSVFGIQVTLEDKADIDEIADGIEDLLDIVDVELEDLSAEEYTQPGDGIRLMLHIDIGELCTQLVEHDDYETVAVGMFDDERDEFADQLSAVTGDLYLYVLVQDTNVVVLLGASVNGECGYLGEFTDLLGFENPSNISANSEIATAIVDAYMSRLAASVELLSAYSEG